MALVRACNGRICVEFALPILSLLCCSQFRLDYALSREQTNKKGGKMYIQDKVRLPRGAPCHFTLYSSPPQACMLLNAQMA
jgi:hypothetical protein